MSAPTLVYVAGPFRSATQWGVAQNIRRAEELGHSVLLAGLFPVIPHANTQHFEGEAPDSVFLLGTLELMRRCDAVIMVAGWEASKGARAERAEALRLGLPVCETILDLLMVVTGAES